MDLLFIRRKTGYNLEKLAKILEPHGIRISDRFRFRYTGEIFEDQELMMQCGKEIDKDFYVFNTDVSLDELSLLGDAVELSFDYIGIGDNQEYTIPYAIFKGGDGIKFYIACNYNDEDKISSAPFDKISQVRNFYENKIKEVSGISDSDFFEATKLATLMDRSYKFVIVHEI